MYLKLMTRGLLRHRDTGKRLFVLLALCSAAVLFFLTFRKSFASRYEQMAIDLATAHLQVLPADSPKLSEDGTCTDHRESLVLLRHSEELERFLRSIPAVKGTMLAVETRATLFTVEGEPTGLTTTLVGVDPRGLARTLPGLTVLEGERDLAWNAAMPDVPVARPPPEGTEVVEGNDRFLRDNFRPRGDRWERFKQTVRNDLPSLFGSAASGGDALGDEPFLALMNAALAREDLPRILAARGNAKYDYRVDDALAALEVSSSNASASTASDPPNAAAVATRQRVLRKRLLQAVYPEAITVVRDSIGLNVRYSMAIPPVRGMDPLASRLVLPVRLAAFVQRVPMFRGGYYVDARALRGRLGLAEEEGTNLYVRLASTDDVRDVRKAIEEWLAARKLDYVVKDYRDTGKLFQSTSIAFQAITLILVGIFVATVAIFVANTVFLAVIGRRRELGTAIAIGFSPRQNAVVIFGEMMLIVMASWAAGAAIATGLILLFHRMGMPGVILMPGNRLVLDLHPAPFAIALFILLSTAAVASLLPLRLLARVKPIDLLKEAA